MEAIHGNVDSVLSDSVTGTRDEKGKSLAWSRGIGLEVSPIKTRSARRKLGTTSISGVQISGIHS
jgi:hypothetical protein